MPISKGDKLILYTDGLIEGLSIRKDDYRIDNLLKLLEKNIEHKPEKLINIVMSNAQEISKKQEQQDDITMVIAEIC